MNKLDIFNDYLSVKDKYESLYIFVIYDFTKEEMEDKFTKLFKQLDGISDSRKKGALKSRISDLKNYMEVYKESVIKGIFLVGDTIKYFDLDKYYLETLKLFKVSKCSFVYNKYFDIEWLKNLISDRSYTTIIKVKNNDVSVTKINSTKQLTVYNETIKSLNIIDIISKHTDKDSKFIINGSSTHLKQLTDYKNKQCLGVILKELNLEEQFEVIDKSIYEENIKELEIWLTKLLDPKEGHKLVFGNDVEEQADQGFLETIYCSIENKEKYSKFENVKIKYVKSFKNTDFVFSFSKNYNGVLGIKYY